MTLGIVQTVRNNQLTQISDASDAGATGATIKIFDGTRPATGGAITSQVLLAVLTMSATAFLAATGGTMTANAITGDTSADNTGTASWFRIEDSNVAFVTDGDVGTAGSDLNLNSVAITAGVQVDITSMVLTAGNA